MPTQAQYRCNNCGHRFHIEILTPEERREAERRQRPLLGISCPQCRRTDVRRGWE